MTIDHTEGAPREDLWRKEELNPSSVDPATLNWWRT